MGSLPSETEFDFTTVADARWSRSPPTPATSHREEEESTRATTVRRHFEPEGESPIEMARSWRSIQSDIDDGEDLTRQEFIEFFIRGALGTITVDLGTVDEDRVRRDDEGIPSASDCWTPKRPIPIRATTRSTSGRIPARRRFGERRDRGAGGRRERRLHPVQRRGQISANPNGTENNNTLDTEDDNFNGLLDRSEDALRWVVDLSDPRYEVPGSRNR